MFQAGDLLVYGTTGVCRVLSIDRRQERVGSTRQERLYYQLKPIYQGGLIYTPVDNDKVSMRPIISRQEAEDLISEIPTLHPAACRASSTPCFCKYRIADSSADFKFFLSCTLIGHGSSCSFFSVLAGYV